MKKYARRFALLGCLCWLPIAVWSQIRIDVVALRAVSCASGSDGLIVVQAVGGEGPYEYALDNRGFRFGNRFENLRAGSYLIQARDRRSQEASLRLEVTQPQPLAWDSLSVVEPSRCSAPGNGQIVARARGGTAPYEYRLAGSGVRPDGRFGGLLPGTYRLRAIDRKDCTHDTLITLADPLSQRNLRFEARAARCADSEDGELRIGGDTDGLLFSLDGLEFGPQTHWNNLAGRRGWLVFSRDTTGCLRTDNVFVPAPAPLKARLLGQVAARCGSANGVLRFGATGGTPPYQFVLANGSDTLRNADGRFDNLRTGSYDLIVRDDQGCGHLLIVDLPEQGDLGLNLTIEHPLCLQVPTGRIEGRSTRGTPPVRYRLNNGPWQERLSFANLDRGLYRLTTQEATGCQQDTLIELYYQNQIRLRIDERPPTCTEDAIYADGQLHARARGGTPPYRYALNGGPWSTDSVFRGLLNGGYVIQVSDTFGCQTDAVIFLFAHRELRIDYAIRDVTCRGDSTGEVRIRVRGGNTGHWFGLHPRALNESDSIYTHLPAGPFVVYVMDRFGCIDRDTVQVGSPDSLLLRATSTTPSCPARSDGWTDLDAQGGRGPYRLVWLATGDTLHLPARQPNLAAGTHWVALIDSAGCRRIDSVAVGEPTLQVAVEPAVCGGAEGRIELHASGLRPPVSYRYIGATDSSSQAENVFTQLVRGLYHVEALGAEACTLQAEAHITGPDPLRVQVRSIAPSSCRTDDGLLHVAASGGQRPYTYSLADGGFQSDSVFAFLAPERYTLVVRDAAGCTTQTLAHVEPAQARFRLTVLTREVSCAGGTDGWARVEVRDGSPPYEFLWADGTTNAELNRQPAGLYPVVVADQTGCRRRDTAQIGEPPALRLELRIDTLERSYRLTARASGGRPPYRFSLNDGLPQRDSVYAALEGGAYVLTVIDANDCTHDRAFELEPIAVGRQGRQQFTLVLYPNPTTGLVWVRLPEPGAVAYTLTDGLGRRVLAGTWPEGRINALDLSELPAGIYWLQVGEPALGAKIVRQ